ncbi:MAG: hypothetical protein A2143_01785 [Gallionellales bacterium RBG_16_57_15]|nr:MAG: hypothetical protein A2143_01785 [Gallionellales bacterium RBG_16_57_15]
MRVVRLLVGADVCARSQIPVAEEFVPQVAAARAKLASMRASDVMDAVISLSRSGLGSYLDVRSVTPRTQEKELSRPPDTRRR